jgi:hypothetical protein
MGVWTTTPRTWVAGEVPTATHFNENVRDLGRAFADAWTSYTPTLTASTTNPTNWTQSGYYCRAGKLVVAKFTVQAGASMTTGSGTYRIALPVNGSTTLASQYLGTITLRDASTGNTFYAQASLADTSYVVLNYAATYGGGTANAAHNAPWTWAASDTISGTIMYEAA